MQKATVMIITSQRVGYYSSNAIPLPFGMNNSNSDGLTWYHVDSITFSRNAEAGLIHAYIVETEGMDSWSHSIQVAVSDTIILIRDGENGE